MPQLRVTVATQKSSVKKTKLLRITTVPISLQLLLKGQFKYMIEHDYEVITISADGNGVEDVKAEGAQHIAIPFTRKITPVKDLKCLWLLINTIKQHKPDIIHTHTPKAGLLGMLAGRYCNVPVRMHTVAGLPLMESGGMKRKILEFTERMTYAAATKVYPNSKGLGTFMTSELKVNPSKLKIIGRGSSNGINTDYFTSTDELRTQRELIRDKYDISKRDIVFSFVGRIVRDKGIVELVTAFRKLSENKEVNAPKYFLMLVGPFEEELDPLPPEIMRFLSESSNIILPGFQKDVRPWLLASDIFVFPSYREGFPNVVMQASLLEVPCIVSDINGCNEIIEDKVTGLIVPPKSDSALLAAMTTLANDPTLCKQYATKARAFVADNFDRNRVWEGIRLEYEALMSNVECRMSNSGLDGSPSTS